tara:strand:+ start:2650 stop:3672 length:1023 start_codon:yes stop_codon:yes gene_type:complete
MANVATMLTRRKIVQVSIEATKGTYLMDTPIHVLAMDPVIQLTDSTQQRQPSSIALGNYKASPGEQIGTCNMRVEMRGDGAADWDNGLEALLQACGFSLSSKVLSPVSAVSSMKTVSLAVYEDGIIKRLAGAMGNVRFTGEFGKQVFAEFEFTGVWKAPTDKAITLASPTINSQLPMRLANSSFSLAGATYTPYISTITIDMGNTVSMVEDITQNEGVLHAVITERNPVITMDAQAETIANYDAFGLWLAGTEAAFSLIIHNGTDQITIAAPKLQHQAPQEGDRDGKLTHEYTAQCNISTLNTGNDELTMTAATYSAVASSSPSSSTSASVSSSISSSAS